MTDETRKSTDPDFDSRLDANRDPITGAPGSHPVGTGVGAAGAGAAGAAIGSVAGPVGTAVGAIVGAVAGGLAGKGVAESVNPTAEDEYWRNNYKTRPYVMSGTSYDEYAPAYRYGWESRNHHAGKRFEDVESDLRSGWESTKGKTKLEWDRARSAVRDAWDRVGTREHANVNDDRVNASLPSSSYPSSPTTPNVTRGTDIT
jgi:hypothetical protein